MTIEVRKEESVTPTLELARRTEIDALIGRATKVDEGHQPFEVILATSPVIRKLFEVRTRLPRGCRKAVLRKLGTSLRPPLWSTGSRL